MDKMPSFIIERDKEFYRWLITQACEKTVTEFYATLPFVNEYGQRHKSFTTSLFELDDSISVRRFRDLINGDKRFKFMHYGQAKKILMLLDEYCEFIEDKKESPSETRNSEKHNPEEINTAMSNPENKESVMSKPMPIEPKLSEAPHLTKKPGSIIIRTLSGSEYVGDTPAEALADLCEALSAKYPEIITSLIGRKVLSAGSPSGERIELQGVHSYIDKALKMETAMRFAKWLCESCEEADLPESINVLEQETEDKQDKAVSTEKTKHEKPVASISRGWSKYEVALLIETYLKASGNGYLKAAAEALSHELRELARKNGKTIDASYRNLNGIVMQLGTVQYCFTDGKKGLSNASTQIREMVELYNNDHEAYEKILQEAHLLVDKPENESAALLGRDEYVYALSTRNKQQENDDSQVSTASFRKWLEVHFRGFLTGIKHLAPRTVSQYCQSIEAIEQYLIKNHPSLTLEGVTAEQVQDIQKALSVDWEYIQWNMKGHHQYSAALAQYVHFLRSGYRARESRGEYPSLKNIVISVLTKSCRPMTTAEIYAEIEKNKLYTFNSTNPHLIVDHAIRRSCVGVRLGDHLKEDVFGIVRDAKGVPRYYLLEWDAPLHDSKSEEPRAESRNEKTKIQNEDNRLVEGANKRWAEILARCFPDGFILDDFLSQLQAKTFWQEAYAEECPLDGADIDAAIKLVGTVRDGRVFVHKDEEDDLISTICAEISGLLDEYTSVYRKCIYERYQDKLAQCSIYTETIMEEQLLKKANGSFYCAWQIFMRKGRESSVTLDCRKVLRNHGGAMHVSDIRKILWFIPGDSVYHTLSVDKETLNIGNSVWMLAEHFPLTSEEASRIGDVLDEYFVSSNYIRAESMLPLLHDKLPSVAENLQGLHFTAIFNIIRYYLEDCFSFTKSIVAPRGSKKIDFSVLYHDFADQRDHFTLDELTAFSKEMKVPIYWESIFSGGVVRVNSNEMVHKVNVHFDIDETDKVLEDICPGDYIPFYAVSPAMMMHLPPCGYQWNGYLLLNYVYSFSKIFRALYKSMGKTGYYGAMVRKDCSAIGNYNQLLIRFLTDDNTWKTVDDACELIVKNGLQAAKDIGGIEKIVSQAKLNKLKKGSECRAQV